MLFFNVYVGKELHHFFGHDHHHDHEIDCPNHGDYEHFHDGTLTWEDCLVCHFNTAPVEETSVATITMALVTTFTEANFIQENAVFSSSFTSYYLRGPPR